MEKDKSWENYDLKQRISFEEESRKEQRIYAEAELSDFIWRLKNFIYSK